MISTNLEPKKTDEVWDSLTEQYHTHETDVYMTAIGQNRTYNTKGEVIEFQVLDLGHESRYNRLEKFKEHLEEMNRDYKDQVTEYQNTYDEDTQDLKSVTSDLKAVNDKIRKIEDQKGFKRKITENKLLQSEYEGLIAEKENLEKELTELTHRVKNFDSFMSDLKEEYETRVQIMEGIISRDEVYNTLNAEELKYLRMRKEQITSNLETARATHKQNIKGNGNGKTKSQPQLVAVNTTGEEVQHPESFKEIQEEAGKLVKQFDVNRVNELRIRALELSLKRVQSQIKAIEQKMSSIGTVKERYYVTREFKQDGKLGDLVVFSRRLQSQKGNIESEMTHSPRFRVDPREANKTLNYLIFLLMLGNMFFTGSIFAGVVPNLLTWHTFYLLIITGMIFYNNIRNQTIDKIFEAFYYYFDATEMDIPYRDKDGVERTFKAKCYHLELFYSDKLNVTEFFRTTEADIIEAQDERLINMVNRFQILLSQASMDINNYREQTQVLTQKNQDIVGSYKELEVNVKSAVKREYDYKKEEKESALKTTLPDIVKYAGYTVLLYMFLTMFGEIFPTTVNVTNAGEGGSGGLTSSFTFGLIIGFFLGAIAIVSIMRMSRTH